MSSCQDALERKLYVIRKTASAAIQALGLKHSKEYYVPSMSSRTVVYKGLLLADQVGVYFGTWKTRAACRPSAWCTSAFPPTPSPSGRWPTLPVCGAQRRDQHRQGQLQLDEGARGRDVVPVLGRPAKLYPISFADQSDTATFDNCLELLTMAATPSARP